jgi:acid phosphatase
MHRRRFALLALVAAAFTLLAVQASTAAQPLKKKPPKHHVAPKKRPKPKPKPRPMSAAQKLAHVKHLVVIYEENHSFDNLYGGWEGVRGRSTADSAHTTQINEAGAPYTCLLQNDVNLAAPPQSPTCTDTTTGTSFTSHFSNAPFLIDDYLKPTDTTCPPNPNAAFSSPNGFAKGTGSPGGCTRDIVHEFYQEQYDLNGGAQNRYVTGSDAVGMVMGQYDTKALPVYRYLHQPSHPKYVILDDFFQAAFGGSYLNHQWLVAAASPTYPNAPANLQSIIDSNGMPVAYPLYKPTGTVLRGPLTVTCPSPVANRACGDYSVNTQQPSQQPFGAFGAKLPLQTHTTIGDRLTAKGVDWAWYAGGWSNAAGVVNGPGWTNGAGPKCSDPNAIPSSPYPYCPDGLFQFHHQPFNYFAQYGPNTAGRDHLKDEAEFESVLSSSGASCGLKPVSFVKPIGEENEHPGYASTPNGESHLVDLLRSIESGACAKDTMIVVTYDEFGGQWDHVPPPGQAGGPAGPHDIFGPGTRIPALVLSPYLTVPFAVDHTEYDTTAILKTIEQRWQVQALGTRDAAQHSLANVFIAKASR